VLKSIEIEHVHLNPSQTRTRCSGFLQVRQIRRLANKLALKSLITFSLMQPKNVKISFLLTHTHRVLDQLLGITSTYQKIPCNNYVLNVSTVTEDKLTPFNL